MMAAPRRKILFVHHGTGLGGAPQLLLKFLEHLDRTQYEPVIWCIRKSSASDLFEQHGFRVVFDPRVTPFLHISDGFYGISHPHRVATMALGQLTSYRTARRMFGELKPDLIHVNSVVLPGVLCAASKCGCPVIVNVLECLHQGYTGLRRWLMKTLTCRWADYFVFMLASEARRWGVLESGRAVVVHDFIDNQFLAAIGCGKLKTEYCIPNTMPLLGYLGRFTKAKGVHYLVQALGMLKRRGVAFHAFLVGPRPAVPKPSLKTRIARLLGRRSYIETLDALIAREGVEDEVTFTGERTDIGEIVSELDLLVIPFTEPHFSRLCGEAAMMGKVAIAFDIDGPGEEIRNGRTGWLVKPFDVAALAECIEHALANPDECRRMGEAAKHHAAEVFDAEKNVARVLDLYRKAFQE